MYTGANGAESEEQRTAFWTFVKNLHMEQDNENMVLGKLLNEITYGRAEKHLMLDDTITFCVCASTVWRQRRN